MQNELLSCAIRAALLAGKDILNIYNDPKADFAIERKADNSPLTIADKRSHAHIMDELDATSIPVLSEEGRLTDYNIRKGWKTLWVVDPLDGTKEFIKRNGEFTVNIALVENGIPVLGVIYVPVSRTLYFSEDSIGAYRIEGIDARSAGLFSRRSDGKGRPVAFGAGRHERLCGRSPPLPIFLPRRRNTSVSWKANTDT